MFTWRFAIGFENGCCRAGYVCMEKVILCVHVARAEYVVDNLGAARGRLPDAAMRKRMEQFIDNV